MFSFFIDRALGYGRGSCSLLLNTYQGYNKYRDFNPMYYPIWRYLIGREARRHEPYFIFTDLFGEPFAGFAVLNQCNCYLVFLGDSIILLA